MQTHSNRHALVLVCTMFFGGAALAHTDADEAIPDAPGVKASLAAAVSSLSAKDKLPSQAMPGYLIKGDVGIDRRGAQLEHGVAQLGYRFDQTLGAQLAIGAHGKDPLHVEAAWLQARGFSRSMDWTVGVGRQRPSLGKVMTRTGHLDSFGLMPLAKQALTDGDWIEDGLEASLKRQMAGLDWTLDAGVWRGRSFPGGAASSANPAVHLGAVGHHDAGEWAVDAFVAQLKPQARGSRIFNATGAHTHAAPVCDASLNGVVCFEGRSRLLGVSAQWEGRTLPVTVTGAMLWRNEQGSLISRNGQGQYDGRNRGEWLQAVWRMAPAWDVGVRLERLKADQSLMGAGASLVASEGGFGNYSRLQRQIAMAGYALAPWADLRLELGRDSASVTAARFAALRLVLQWDRSFSK